MSSTINTNGVDVNYPVPGINNSSQGFRDNFAAIKTNLNAAGTEISDLQSKVVLKQALANTTINNDMANTLISNAATRSFRATTYNLGNALSGTVLVDVSLADVHIGTIAANTTLQFGGWAPAGTQSNVQLQLAVSNSSAVLSFPAEVNQTGSYGVETLENYANVAGTATISIPYGVSQVDYRVSTVDCGANLTIEPFNRPRIDSQIQRRTPAPTGFQGDVAGTVAVDSSYMYVCTASFDSGNGNTIAKTASATTTGTNLITLNNATSLVTNAPIIFSGTTFGGIIAGTIYYIKSIVGSTITVSDTRTGGTAGTTFPLSSSSGTMTGTSYNGSVIWKRIALTAW